MAASSVSRNNGSAGWKKSRGCGSNVSTPAGRLSSLASFTRHRNDGLVAAMNAIEIAHGEDSAAQRAIGRGIAHDEEAFRRHLTSRVGET